MLTPSRADGTSIVIQASGTLENTYLSIAPDVDAVSEAIRPEKA